MNCDMKKVFIHILFYFSIVLIYTSQSLATEEPGILNAEIAPATPSEEISYFYADEVADPCPTYKRFKRTIVYSSTRGQLQDTDWLEDGVFDDCNPVQTGELSPNCQTQVIPGRSVGDGDESIETCIYTKVICIANCRTCEASTQETEVSITFPNIQFLKDRLKQVAEAAPMIQSFELSIGGAISRKTGEECCLADAALPPVQWTEYAGTVTAGLSVTLNVPGWSWKVRHEWQGIYRVYAQISLGPTVTLSPSASASISGRMYDQNKCPSCVTTSVTGQIGLGVAFGGKIACLIRMFEGSWFEVTGKFELSAELSLSSSISVSGNYKWQGCPRPGLSGSFGYGALTGTARASVVVWGTNISISRSVTLLNGHTINF